MALLIVVLGAFAGVQLTRMKGTLDEVERVHQQSLILTYEMAEQQHVVARVMRTIVLLDDASARERETPKIDQARAAYQQAQTALNAMPATAQGLALRVEIARAAAAARQVNDEILKLAAQDQDEAAVALMISRSIPLGAAWQDALDRNIQLQRTAVTEAGRAATRQVQQALITLALAALVAVGLALVLGWRITRSIVVPLQHARDAARHLAAGDLCTTLAPAHGMHPRDEAGQLLQAMHALQAGLRNIIGQMDDNAGSVATAAQQISAGNTDLSRRTEQQAAALQQTAATMDQLTATVRGNGEATAQARLLADNACTVTSRGAGVMRDVVGTMQRIEHSSRKVQDIVGAIDGIAFQTNILALNAAVEAARAGEQGRGFAVVAGEVRTLAQRAAAASREIRALIDGSTSEVQTGGRLVDEAQRTMAQIEQSIREVNVLVSEIQTATEEQTQGIVQVGQAMAQLDRATQQNAALVEESAAAAESLDGQAAQLSRQVARFKLPRERAVDPAAA
jgi:methyl-accepting chemotaxis protein